MLKRHWFLLSFISIFCNLFAEYQTPDYCFFLKKDGKIDTLLLYAYPLESYFDQQDIRSISNVKGCESENCQRGYQAIWKVDNDSLFLIGLQSCNSNMSWCDESVLPSLTTIFGDKCVDGKVFASWVNGELQLFGGARVPNIKQTIFSYDQYLEIKNGYIYKNKCYHNVYQRNRSMAMETNTPYILVFQLQNNLNWKKLSFLSIGGKSFVDINITIKKNGYMVASSHTNLSNSKLKQLNKEINRCFMNFRWYQYRHKGKKININFVLQTEIDLNSQKIRLLK